MSACSASSEVRTPSRRLTVLVAVALLAMMLGQARAADAVKLDYVPTDAVAAVVLQPAKLMKSPEFELWPTEVITAVSVQSAGIDPADVELAIGIAGMEGWTNGQPSIGVILHAAKALAKDDVLAKLNANTPPIKFEGKQYFKSEGQPPLFLHFPNDRTLVGCANEAYLKKMIAAKPGKSALHDLLRRVDLTRHASAVVDFAKIRPLVVLGLQQVPPPPAPFDEFLPLPELVASIELSLKLGDELDVKLVLGADNAEGAKELQGMAEKAKEIARQFVDTQLIPELARGGDPVMSEAMSRYIQRITKFGLDRIELAQQDKQLTIEARVPLGMAANGAAVGMLLPAVQAAREAARRAQGSNNLKQIGLAMHLYHDTYNKLPAPAIRDKEGKKALLSWRVAILPFIEQENLYRQFHLDEPWDSEHNKKLIEQMPAVFRSANQKSKPGTTVYLAADGKGSMFEGPEAIQLQDITDGTSNTIMVVEADDEKAVPWTKPEDLRFNAEKPFDGLGHLRPNIVQVLFGDASVMPIGTYMDEDTFRALFTRAGGEAIRLDKDVAPVGAAVPEDQLEVFEVAQ